MQALIIGAVLVFTLALGPLSVVLAPSDDGGPFVVVTPPWSDGQAVIAAAGGRVIGPLSAPFGMFASATDPEFPKRVKEAGGWAVLNGSRLAQLCGVDDV